MSKRRIFFFAFFLFLPAMLLIGAWAFYLFAVMPSHVKSQQTRIGKEYRRLAAEFMANPERATYVGGRIKGWRKVSDIDGRPWGHVHSNGVSYVWFQSAPKEWRMVEVMSQESFPYELVFYWGGGIVALVLVMLSSFAVWCLIMSVRERDDFLAATAHDLTTPLVGMRMVIGRDDAEARVLNERMLRLVANIKDYLRMGGRRASPKLEAFDLRDAYAEAYALFAADYRDLFDGKDVNVDASRLSGAMVKADRTLVVQILWNILGNDLKYAAPHGSVRVEMFAEGSMVICEFVDEGPGMTPRQMRKAFNRYYRAKTAMQSGKGGFGIGLCTAREFARSMGGDLKVSGNYPRGCVFRLSLRKASESLQKCDIPGKQ